MAAETGVCKVAREVARIEGKSGLDTCSARDLPKPDCSGVDHEDLGCDPDNSHVFVTGADAKRDDPLEIKVVAAIDASDMLESESSIENFGLNLDVNEEACESLLDGKNGTVEGKDVNPLMINAIPAENEISPVGGIGALDVIKENSLEPKCWENLDAHGNLDVDDDTINKTIKMEEHVDGTHRKPLVVNGNILKQESFLGDGDGIEDKIEVYFRKTECGAEAEIEHVAEPNRKIETFEIVVVEKANDRNVKTGRIADTELRKLENQVLSESTPRLEENQESEVPNLGLVAETGEVSDPHKLLSPFNESVQRGHEVSLRFIETSQVSVEDAVDCPLQEVCGEANEVKCSGEVMETVDGEVHQVISLNPGLECCETDNNNEIFEAEANSASNTGVGDDRKFDMVPGNRTQCSLGKNEKGAINMDYQLGTVCDKVPEEKNKELSVFHIEDNIQYHEDAGKLSYSDEVPLEKLSSEIETEASVLSRSISASRDDVHEFPTKVKVSDPEIVFVEPSSSLDGAASYTVENGPSGLCGQEIYSANCINSSSDPTLEMDVCIEKEQIFKDGNALAGTEVSSWKSEDGHTPRTCIDVELEPECHDSSALGNVDLISDVAVTSGIVILDNFVDNEVSANISFESVEAKYNEEEFSGVMGNKDETSLLQGNEGIGIILNENISKASSEGSSTDPITGEDVSVDTVTKPFNFLIRIPRFSGEKLKEQIKDAKLEVNEKTKLRDAVQAKIQEKRANNQIHAVDYERAKGEIKSLRKLVAIKRMEIGSIQSLISKAKNAISIEDMDSRINSIEHMIQHETLPLREEKELIREIKQLNQLREQLSSNMGSQSEVQHALEQREEAEERLKILRRELATLKDKMAKAQRDTMDAESKHGCENKKIKELQAEFRAADDIRQTAYAKWQTLRKQLSQKNKNFVEYKGEEAEASNCAFSGYRDALYHLCMNQVEKFMELWNRDSDFRSEYVRFNKSSTVRRLGTLDGRSLGPDEKPPILPNYSDTERSARMVSISANVDSRTQTQPVELDQQISSENVASDVQSIKTVTVAKNEIVSSKGHAKSKSHNASPFLPGKDVTEEMLEEDSVKTREEVELISKPEQIRREEVEAKRKEELRMEQVAKAKEAREKKKRHDEKVQMREELRAQKEADLKEKEKEKKLRKRERKKAASVPADVNDGSETGESAMDTVKEDIQGSDNSSCATSKKPKKTSIASKQNKIRSLPPPLRNRNRKKLQQWMWVSLTSLLVILVFWLGNMGLFANVNLKRHNRAY